MSPFEVLGIPSNSDVDQIKSAFRNLAMKYHPDSSSGYADAEKFIEIRTAYEQALRSSGSQIDISGLDISDLMIISVKESLGFLNKSFQLLRNVKCDCGSLGVRCIKCHGSKYLKFGFNSRVKCSRCKGSGFENPYACGKCGGSGEKQVIESIKIKSDTVINDGEMRYYKYSLGKLLLTFKIEKSDNDLYERLNNDLVYFAKISPIDQILGTTLLIPRVNNESVKLSLKENLPIPSYYKIPNSGVPNTNGDLIVKVIIDHNLMDLSLIPKIREAIRR